MVKFIEHYGSILAYVIDHSSEYSKIELYIRKSEDRKYHIMIDGSKPIVLSKPGLQQLVAKCTVSIYL